MSTLRKIACRAGRHKSTSGVGAADSGYAGVPCSERQRLFKSQATPHRSRSRPKESSVALPVRSMIRRSRAPAVEYERRGRWIEIPDRYERSGASAFVRLASRLSRRYQRKMMPPSARLFVPSLCARPCLYDRTTSSRSSAGFEDFDSLPFDDRAADQPGGVQAQLATAGMPIGQNDLLIAASAAANNLTLVTHNTAEFQRVSGSQH